MLLQIFLPFGPPIPFGIIFFGPPIPFGIIFLVREQKECKSLALNKPFVPPNRVK